MSNLSPSDEKNYLHLYSTAIESGINSFDTAPNYLNGYSDKFLGKLIKTNNRDQLFLTSKVFFENSYSNKRLVYLQHLLMKLLMGPYKQSVLII